jgi:glycosyltransferase involved in cell wall biosynthesis
MQKVALIVPCYNEAKRIRADAFISFLSLHTDIYIFFVNDGSRDTTSSVLRQIQETIPERVFLIERPRNKGKAITVKEGLVAALNNNACRYIGYLDADLSTSLEEFYRLCLSLTEQNADYISGSRIKMLDTNIERSFFRHITGRIIATIIDSKYRLGIYDTQCGAKCFKKEVVELFCQQPFKTKWFFDVEIFLRIKSSLPGAKGIEMPLKKWKDPGGSRINLLSFPAVVKEIFSLFINYRRL